MDHATYSPAAEGGSRREPRGGPDDDAVAHGRARPVCPPATSGDLVRLARLAPGDRRRLGKLGSPALTATFAGYLAAGVRRHPAS